MLKTIRFKFGPTPNAAPIEITPGPMTVIVGPNNSGKSLTLRELERSLEGAEADWDSSHWRVLADIEPGLPPPGSLRNSLLEAIQSDLAYIRPPRASNNPTFWRALAMLLGKTPIELELLQLDKNWLNSLEYIGRTTKSLIETRKLRLSPPILSAAPIEALIQAGWVALQDWLPAQQRAILELVHAVNERSDDALIADGAIDFRGYYAYYRRQSMLLDGSARLQLAQGEACGSLHNDAPSGNIMRLWHKRQNLELLRALVLDAFGLHLCIDLMQLGHARLVLSDKPPPAGIEDRLDAEARRFITAARPLHEFSDGVRTYIGLHTQLIAQDSRFVMIDEPEAFLHPPLARRLGANLSILAAERGSCVFAATHSPDFLMGCIESGVGVNIVRLGYRNAVASAHLLPRDELKTMMVDPLLRSTGILNALFHQAAVVVEGDSDRVFYNEINDRLRSHEPEHPAVMRDCVFLNAQGKANVSRILGVLHRAGVASAGIIDLDLLKDKGICANLLEAMGAPASVCESIGVTRANIAKSVGDVETLCQPGGMAKATPENQRAVRHFIRTMEEYRIFLPIVGRLEAWLSDEGVQSFKSRWIAAIFERLGPIDTGTKPGKGDVWQFIRQIGQTLENARAAAE